MEKERAKKREREKEKRDREKERRQAKKEKDRKRKKDTFDAIMFPGVVVRLCFRIFHNIGKTIGIESMCSRISTLDGISHQKTKNMRGNPLWGETQHLTKTTK